MSSHAPEIPKLGHGRVSDPALSEALAAAGRGWRVLPIYGKVPALPNWPRAASADVETIARWADQYPGCQWGLACGQASGVVVLDVDTRHGGDDALGDLEAQHGPLPATAEVLTGGGGRHVYFAHPGGTVPNSAGRLGPGLDVKADAGMVVLAGSLHASGRRYQWEDSSHPDDVPLAELPGSLRQSVTHGDTCGYVADAAGAGATTAAAGRRLTLDPDLKARVDVAVHATLPKREGERRDLLRDLVRRLKAIPALAALSAVELRPVVAEWHRLASPVIGTKELARTIIDFGDAWRNVREPRGSAMSGAVERAMHADDPPWLGGMLYPDEMRFAARLLRELAGMHDQFYLGVRALEAALKQAGFDLNRNEAGGLLRTFLDDGVLAVAKEANKARRQSREFRFVGGRKGDA